MQLLRTAHYIDTQRTGEEIKRFDLRKPQDVKFLQELTREAFHIAMLNEGKIVDVAT
jgi:hypothetical protein